MAEDLVEFSLSSIGALSLGKKVGGETLTVTYSGTSAVISCLGHGQGDSLARKFRELSDRPAAATTSTAAADPLEQLERLAGLRDKGILSEEEFQTQKSNLLGRM